MTIARMELAFPVILRIATTITCVPMILAIVTQASACILIMLDLVRTVIFVLCMTTVRMEPVFLAVPNIATMETRVLMILAMPRLVIASIPITMLLATTITVARPMILVTTELALVRTRNVMTITSVPMILAIVTLANALTRIVLVLVWMVIFVPYTTTVLKGNACLVVLKTATMVTCVLTILAIRQLANACIHIIQLLATMVTIVRWLTLAEMDAAKQVLHKVAMTVMPVLMTDATATEGVCTHTIMLLVTMVTLAPNMIIVMLENVFLVLPKTVTMIISVPTILVIL